MLKYDAAVLATAPCARATGLTFVLLRCVFTYSGGDTDERFSVELQTDHWAIAHVTCANEAEARELLAEAVEHGCLLGWTLAAAKSDRP